MDSFLDADLIVVGQLGFAPRVPNSAALAEVIAAWLDAKGGRSQSERTRRAYTSTLASYQAALQRVGLDLDAPQGQGRALGLVAQSWAGEGGRGGLPIAPATYNQRLAVISSFFQYAARVSDLVAGNPIAAYVERRPVDTYGSATPLDPKQIALRLGQIDRTTALGLRDYAFLSVAVSTGRRLTELAALRWGDLTLEGERVTLVWRRTKGGKTMRDTLARPVAEVLLAWLHYHYGASLEALAVDAPIWVVLAPRGRGGALSGQSLADVCQRHLGTSKVHSLRHTFAHTMAQAGASVGEVQRRLGHSNVATTDRYLRQLASAENPFADALVDLFGIER